ncbi:hypothetical protein C1H76_2227 [Elsinoe australis]|uniref:Uncharacterized protein n=1 Tax=Elsinoe australis TaxID=40998 RepID=A0A4U7BCF3_9PEZI|nr:hypothetical protein C1H76_2227 [Elsinoe australis]
MAFFRSNVLIFLLLTLVLYSNAAVPSDAVCQRLAPQIALVKSNVRAPNRFCKFFLSRARERTPIPGIKASELTQACACIFKQAGKVQPQLITTPITEIPGTRYRCNNDFVSTIKAAFVNRNAFCNFFVAAIRDDSPFENLNAMQDHINLKVCHNTSVKYIDEQIIFVVNELQNYHAYEYYCDLDQVVVYYDHHVDNDVHNNNYKDDVDEHDGCDNIDNDNGNND